MGLNISYADLSAARPPEDLDVPYTAPDNAFTRLAFCAPLLTTPVTKEFKGEPYRSNRYDELPWETSDRVCVGCPLEAENEPDSDDEHRRTRYGCSPRMGSYSYVAALPAFVRAHAPWLNDEPYVRATRGGGYHPETEGVTDAECLASAGEVRRALAEMPLGVAVGYDADGAETTWIAGHPIDPRWGISWTLMGGSVRVGVILPERGNPSLAKVALSLINRVSYLDETDHPEVLSAFSTGYLGGGRVPVIVRTEVRPALLQYRHLLDTFERIATRAVEHGLTLEDC